jgi:hypothetical protein
MRQIPLVNGRGVTYVSDEDYNLYSGQPWYLSSKGYAQGYIWDETGKRHTVFLHRLVAGTPEGLETDHQDGDRLNNTRENLRVVTPLENNKNRSAPKNKKHSRYKGVTRSGSRWQATIVADRARLYIGTFDIEEDAARAYDAFAIQHHSEYARLNFPLLKAA